MKMNAIELQIDTSDNHDLQETKYVPAENGKFTPTDRDNKPDTCFLYLTILAGTLPFLCGAGVFSWMSPVLPKLALNDTNINPLDKPITTIEISLLSGLPCLAGLVGSFFSPLVPDVIGRKRILQISAVVMILCNIVVAFSSKIIYIIISRCVFFIFQSELMSISPIFITEVCEDHNRAKYGCLLGLFFPLGTLYAFVIGPPLSVKVFTLLLNIPVVISLVLLSFAPESPIFSLSKGKIEECKKSLNKLRSNKNDEELEIDFRKLTTLLQTRRNSTKNGFVTLFAARERRIGILMTFVPNLLQFCCGDPILMQFLGPIFSQASSSISGNNVAIIIGSLKSLLSLVTSFVVERTGRKPLLIYSSLGCGASLIVLGWFFYLKHAGSPLTAKITWLPIISCIIYIISFALGVGPVPLSLNGEMFTTEFRAAASSFTMTLVGIAVFVMTFAFPIVVEVAGLHWCFWIFSINCFIGSAFIFSILPETQGKSLQEIQDMLRNYKFDIKKA